jgi:hypothetical protein
MMADAEIPKDLDEAVVALRQMLPQSELDRFRSWSYEEAQAAAHHSVGRKIRNEWRLWHDSPLSEWFRNELRVTHADDMSGMIFDALWCDLNEQPRRTAKLFAEYQEHWARWGSP